MEKKILLPKDVVLDEEIKTLFKDKNGKYYLSREGAQNELATHFPCKCGNGIREKYRIYCDNCEPPKPEPPIKDWDGKSLLYVQDFDKYFSEIEEIEEYCEEEGHDKHTLTVMICEGNYYYEVTEEYWEDIMTIEDDYVTLPKAIAEKLSELNEAIRNHKEPATWSPSRYKANIEWND